MKKAPLLSIIRSLVKILTKFNIENSENLPAQGGALVTTNHLSRLDTPFLLAITDRDDLVAIVAKKYRRKPFFKWILEKIGTMVWMDRENTDFAAIRDALNYLRLGALVGIAPEGTRSQETKGLLEGKQGAAVLAARANVPIIPVGIIGSDKVNHGWARLRRPPVTIRVGKPYLLPPMDRDHRQAWLTQYTDEIMCRIAVLLPEKYRGYYADHPRLLELLSDDGQDDPLAVSI
ncbi:MAG: 1-acyl-sn-glycerol-3-phosphate acyltransferase [Anaerolineaceae bacterium]|jgi:1-acyl-sn-glycerol-3-phosphate acyltransferase|nr:1-acyl-sn-glycerol-3-phosphate acyltransferase [Anaerolineaceae bacterium]